MRKYFQDIPVRGLFYFVNGTPSGVRVKVSPTQYALPVQAHLDNARLGEFKFVQGSGGGTINTEHGDFVWFTGTRTTVNRNRAVIEVNPSNVVMEADKRDW
jgi:hypothetical protein